MGQIGRCLEVPALGPFDELDPARFVVFRQLTQCGAHIAHDADDLANRFLGELLHATGAATDQDAVRQRVGAVRPMLVRQGLIDDDYRRSVTVVQVVEVASPQDRNLEGFEIAGRAHPYAPATGVWALVGPPDYCETQAVTAL